MLRNFSGHRYSIYGAVAIRSNIINSIYGDFISSVYGAVYGATLTPYTEIFLSSVYGAVYGATLLTPYMAPYMAPYTEIFPSSVYDAAHIRSNTISVYGGPNMEIKYGAIYGVANSVYGAIYGG